MDNYGSFVNNYEAYVDTPGGMEYELGRRQALKQLGDVRGKTILDFGCGPGVNSRRLQEMGATVIGIDISEEELRVARERDPKSTYIHYDGTNLYEALGRGEVDGILASFSFCTIPDVTLRHLLKQMRWLLPTWGRLAIAEPNLEKALGTRYHDLEYHAQPGVKSGDHVHVTLGAGQDAVELYHDIYRRHDDYRRMLAHAGFHNTTLREPRPRGLNLIRWWQATVTPPFLIISAQYR